MAQNSNSNSQISSSIPIPTRCIAEPSSEFYSIFSEEEILEIIHALEIRREFPLKYSYKGRGGKIWDAFYLKYISPRWYRTSSVEVDLLKENFEVINGHIQGCDKVTIVDVGAGNSYPVRNFINRLSRLKKINQYIALDISEELLEVSKRNFRTWFPSIEFISDTIDIENSCVPKTLLKNQANAEPDDTAQIFFHLGVTIGNHHNRNAVFKNFRDSMGKNDLLVFTNEIGSNSQWDGKARGGCKYHAEEIYAWMKNKMGIRAEDCELVRKYDEKRDSVVANIRFRHSCRMNFSIKGVNKTIDISEGEEVTIWRHHKFEISELLQELKQAGLQLVHYGTNKYLSHVLVICEVASN